MFSSKGGLGWAGGAAQLKPEFKYEHFCSLKPFCFLRLHINIYFWSIPTQLWKIHLEKAGCWCGAGQQGVEGRGCFQSGRLPGLGKNAPKWGWRGREGGWGLLCPSPLPRAQQSQGQLCPRAKSGAELLI